MSKVEKAKSVKMLMVNRDLGLIEGTTIAVPDDPVFRRHTFHDLKFLRDKVRFNKGFSSLSKQRNPGMKLLVVQYNYSWHLIIQKIVEGGGTCGKVERGSFMWILYNLALLKQTKVQPTEKLWVKMKKAVDTLDVSSFYDSKPSLLMSDFVLWLINEVRECSEEVQEKFYKTLYPNREVKAWYEIRTMEEVMDAFEKVDTAAVAKKMSAEKKLMQAEAEAESIDDTETDLCL